ncbi:hypothetical protein PR048_012812 [Dryococelus australis]|uniref:Uncharacterized protein n=1 Tax=Dryococelus australis TaxID=614101 RepID=A0ABQ9HR29_9NEOP|nr:hypothetical protein PR048_012812 [Dryococelus australis]
MTDSRIYGMSRSCFILPHENASLESGFSVNKSRLAQNLSEESIVAQHICDTVKSMVGVEEGTVTRSMLTSVRAARRRYQAYLEKKKELNAE